MAGVAFAFSLLMGFLKQVLRGLFFVNCSWVFCAISATICTL